MVVITESHPTALTKVVTTVPAFVGVQVVKLIVFEEFCNNVVIVVKTESHPTALTKVVTTVPALAGIQVVVFSVNELESFTTNKAVVSSV